jgi:hypothetical protein
MVKPKAHRKTKPTKREIRLSRIASAADTIGQVEPGLDVYALTFGQFDLSDVLEHLLNATGPAEVVVATWTAAKADLDRAAAFVEDERVEKLRFIVDQSFPNRQPAYFDRLVNKFGAGSVVTTRSHCKFLLIAGGGFHFCVRTSANLNANKRLENIEVSDDIGLYTFMLEVADEIFAEGGSLYVADLAGIAAVEPVPVVAVGRVVRTGQQ